MMPRTFEISKDVIDLGPGMFISSDFKVLNREGENYYRACNEFVGARPDGSESHCIKPEGHVGWAHEDVFGRERQDALVFRLWTIRFDILHREAFAKLD